MDRMTRESILKEVTFKLRRQSHEKHPGKSITGRRRKKRTYYGQLIRREWLELRAQMVV